MSGFSFQSIEHAFAYVAQKVVAGAKALESVLLSVQKSEALVEEVTGLFDPAAVLIERGAYAVLGLALKAVDDVGAAGAAGGVDISLDVQMVKDLQALLPAIKAQAGLLPVAPAATAPTSTS